jgi:putative tryptophan/tyrosine transport system substrate-binding protein
VRRREFIAGLGSAAAWPVVVQAQRSAMPVIGFLSAGFAARTLALPPFHQGLREAGFVEGQNVTVEYRWAEGHFDRLPGLAFELVNRGVAVIHANGGLLPAIAARAATKTIPIVFQGGGDPIGSGLVASLNRPGGNVTGALNLTGAGDTFDAKGAEFLHELVPSADSIGIVTNPNNLSNQPTRAEAAVRAIGWEVHALNAISRSRCSAVPTR